MLKFLSTKQFRTTLALALMALTALVSTPLAASAQVLPANAQLNGYSLSDMASQLALFDTSGNDPGYLPSLPFQVVYLDPSTVNVTPLGFGALLITGGNAFTVAPGTEFFVPIIYEDDSPLIIGNWPASASGAIAYFFGRKQLGFTAGSITIDNGPTVTIGASYLAGPVQVPFLLDGSGTHLMQLGFFMSALSSGKHTLVVRGALTGSAFEAATGQAYQVFHGTYTVTVTGP